MSPRITNILLSVALLGCGIYAYQWHGQLESLQTSLVTLKAERDRLNRRVAELKEVKPAALEPVETPQGEASDVMAARRPGLPSVEAGTPMTEAVRGEDGRARFMAMLDNPEIQKLMSIQQKAALDARFAGLFRALNLSPADLEKFKSLLVEKQTAVTDARAAARAQGLTGSENRDALRQVIANAQAEVDGNIRSTLGEAVFAQYQSYEQTLPERNLVNQLQQRLSYSSSPLTDAQSNQVVAFLAANHSVASQSATASAATGMNNNFTQFRNGGGNAPITDAVIAGSQGILNSIQIAALTQLQQEQQVQAQLAAQLRAGRGRGPTTAGPTGTVVAPSKP